MHRCKGPADARMGDPDATRLERMTRMIHVTPLTPLTQMTQMTQTIEEGEDCPICLESLDETLAAEKTCTLRCQHKYHVECLTTYAHSVESRQRQKPSCPMCRGALVLTDKSMTRSCESQGDLATSNASGAFVPLHQERCWMAMHCLSLTMLAGMLLL